MTNGAPCPMTDDQLEAIARRVRSVGTDPWTVSHYGSPGDQEPTSIAIHAGAFGHEAIRFGEADVVAWLDAERADRADLIVGARQDILALLAEVGRARAAEARALAAASIEYAVLNGLGATVARARTLDEARAEVSKARGHAQERGCTAPERRIVARVAAGPWQPVD